MSDKPNTIPFSDIPRTAVDTDDKIKAALKEGLQEWLDDKILTFGKWSMMTLAAAALAGLVYFILTLNGWKHSP